MIGVIALAGLSCFILRLKIEGEGMLSLKSLLVQDITAGAFASLGVLPSLEPSGLVRFRLTNLFCLSREGE